MRRSLVAAFACALIAAPPAARAGSMSLTFAGVPPGRTAASSYDTTFPTTEAGLVTARPGYDATAIGAGDTYYAGGGLAFPDQWSLGYQYGATPQYIEVSALDVVVAAGDASPQPVTLTATAPNAGVSWSWTIAGPGTYAMPSADAGLIDDALVFTATTAGMNTTDWQVVELDISYARTGQIGPPIPFVGGGGGGGGGGATPEPSSAMLGLIGLACLAPLARRRCA